MKLIAMTLGALVAALALAACAGDDGDGESGLPQGGEPVELDPADCTTKIDNPYWPMAPEIKWVYRDCEAHVHRPVSRTWAGARRPPWV
jgi:hypothetical protein